jgi:hypothetical protein
MPEEYALKTEFKNSNMAYYQMKRPIFEVYEAFSW